MRRLRPRPLTVLLPRVTVPAVSARAAGSGPALALVLAAIGSVQFGAALAATLFDELGASGAVLLRLGFATVALLALWRPRVRGHAPADLATAAAFGAVLGAMNWAFYESIERIPLGIAVTLEFVGPLGVALAGSGGAATSSGSSSPRRGSCSWACRAGRATSTSSVPRSPSSRAASGPATSS